MEVLDNSNNDSPITFGDLLSYHNSLVEPFSAQALVKKPVKDETYIRISQLGTQKFGENFAGSHELIMGERDISIVNPEEFFFHEEGLNGGKLTSEQEKARRDFLSKQEDLYLSFYRKNMGLFSVDGVVSTIQGMKEEIDPEVLKESLLPKSE